MLILHIRIRIIIRKLYEIKLYRHYVLFVAYYVVVVYTFLYEITDVDLQHKIQIRNFSRGP